MTHVNCSDRTIRIRLVYVALSVLFQVVIDSCCATVAEYRKRGKEFWAEFELYMADLLVGIVVDVALVGMLAPYARIGKKQIRGGSGFLGSMQLATAALPSRSLVHFIIINLIGYLLKIENMQGTSGIDTYQYPIM